MPLIVSQVYDDSCQMKGWYKIDDWFEREVSRRCLSKSSDILMSEREHSTSDGKRVCRTSSISSTSVSFLWIVPYVRLRIRCSNELGIDGSIVNLHGKIKREAMTHIVSICGVKVTSLSAKPGGYVT
jgi:hypothetical protein